MGFERLIQSWKSRRPHLHDCPESPHIPLPADTQVLHKQEVRAMVNSETLSSSDACPNTVFPRNTEETCSEVNSQQINPSLQALAIH